ncbi:MAG: GNAT family N-acetyltransferase [Planctomycetota bacterium]
MNTPRLLLRALTVRDAPAYFAAIDGNRRHLGQWFPWVQEIRRVKNATDYIRLCQERRRDRTEFSYGIFQDTALIGDISLTEVSLDDRRGEIGFWLVRDATGRGYMTEAVAGLSRASYRHLNLDRIEIYCEPQNAASRGIPRRLGFTYEGTLRHAERRNNRPRDHEVYSLLRSEFRASRWGFLLARRTRD